RGRDRSRARRSSRRRGARIRPGIRKTSRWAAARGAQLGKGAVGAPAGAGVGSGAGSAPEAARGALLFGSSELGRGRSGERPCWRTPRREAPLGARGSRRAAWPRGAGRRGSWGVDAWDAVASVALDAGASSWVTV